MNPMKVNLIGLTVGLYLLLPIFFRVGPVSVYLLVILAACVYAALLNVVRLPHYALTNPGWDVRLLLLLVPMLYHGEFTAIIIYFVAPGLLFLLLMNRVRTRRQVDRVLDVIIYCSVVNVAISFIEIATGFNLSYALCTDGTVSYESMYRYEMLRVAGAFVNPINNGIFGMMASALVLYRIYSGELSPRKRKNFWLIWLADIAIVVLTSSRAALLAAAAVNVLVFWLSGAFHPTAKTLLALLAMLAVGLFLLIIPNPVSDKISEIIIMILKLIDDLMGTNMARNAASQAVTEGIGNRLDLYQWVVEDVGEDYLLGKGKASQFQHVADVWGNLKESIENQYLFEYYKYGIFGLVGKIFLFVFLLGAKFKALLAERKAGVKLGLNSVLFVVFLVYFLVLFTVAQNEEKKLFYLLVVLGEIYSRNRFFEKETKNRIAKEEGLQG